MLYINILHFQLYPFGFGVNDNTVGPTDDGSSPLITLTEDFVYFNQSSRRLFVCEYKHISSYKSQGIYLL